MRLMLQFEEYYRSVIRLIVACSKHTTRSTNEYCLQLYDLVQEERIHISSDIKFLELIEYFRSFGCLYC